MSAKAKRFEYSVEVRRTEDGQTFGRRRVPDAYLESCRQQVVFLAQRRGLIGADPAALTVVEQPAFEQDGQGQISGVTMHVGKGRKRVERRFGIELFEPFVESVAEQLLRAQQLDAQSRVTYRAYAQAARAECRPGGLSARVRHEPLPLQSGRLDEWLQQATPVGPACGEDYPLFVLDQALQQAAAYCCQGRGVEGGVWLVGTLYRQRKPRHEIFGVIHTVLEAAGLARDRYQMGLTSETFLQLKAQLRRRRACLGCTGELQMGFYHTHPFVPSELDGHQSCSSCLLKSRCNMTSSFLSRNDVKFHAAIFGRAAYAVEMVLGLTPREEPDLRMFCLDGGRFRQRGYHRVAAPSQHPVPAKRSAIPSEAKCHSQRKKESF